MTGLLEEWRRTHYTKNINVNLVNKEIIVMGWVHEIRDLGGIIFVLIRDRDGLIQVTAPSKEIEAELLSQIRKLKKESVVAIKGTIQESSRAPNGVEIIPNTIKVLNEASQPLPMDPTDKVRAEIDTRLDSRFIDLRRANVNSIFKIKSKMLHSTRTFFEENGFLEVNTPKLVASATEGGTELFPITYFEREAFLGQSPQLYKQIMMSGGFDKVYEIAQIFRAEEHDTLRHLNEAISIDMEASFIDDIDAMDTLEKLVNKVIVDVTVDCKDSLKTLDKELLLCECPFERLDYDDAIDMINSKGVEIEWGEDLSRAAEKALGGMMEGYYFLTGWPTEIKPFYVMPNKKHPEKSHAFDLMYKDIEISSGAMRIHQHEMLVEKITEKGLNPDSFDSYLKAFDYGMPPHSGWGLGADRFTMSLTGVNNIRETVLFPRDRRRLTP
ncbi:aspartate--tRNA(Asn) ligase [Methanobrevibacter filiformis]|uniref:Aspartate--tRNA(Asp/Asn) ligase n=1 Tax=Methanobrevibacter filiformis TaxID=55758 RepID=A0A166AMK1_9EURY|nr:aspartate--tRNA(Asn) ligase [Methanobrevibacter filiformis]KZX12232.1 asparagine--tRNA ligase [Methanobrevibacter filiformis]